MGVIGLLSLQVRTEFVLTEWNRQPLEGASTRTPPGTATRRRLRSRAARHNDEADLRGCSNGVTGRRTKRAARSVRSGMEGISAGNEIGLAAVRRNEDGTVCTQTVVIVIIVDVGF